MDWLTRLRSAACVVSRLLAQGGLSCLDWLQRKVRSLRGVVVDRITNSYLPADTNDGHNTGFANQPSIWTTVEHSSQQTWLEALDLNARVSQSGDFQNNVFANQQQRSSG